MVVLVLFLMASSCEPMSPSCSTLSACLARLDNTPVAAAHACCGLDDGAEAVSAGFERLTPPPVGTLVGLLSSTNPRHRDIAAHALGNMGALAAVPALLRHLDDTRWSAWAIGRVGRVGRLWRLGRVGRARDLDNARVIPALVARLGTNSTAGPALADLGAAGIAALARALVSRAPHWRHHGAAEGLRYVDDDVRGAVAVLGQALATADALLQREIVEVLRSFGHRAHLAVAAIRALLPLVEPATREMFVETLVVLGDVDSVAAFAEQARHRPWALWWTLSKLGSHASAAVPVLIDVVRNGTWRNRSVQLVSLASAKTGALSRCSSTRSHRRAGASRARPRWPLGASAGRHR